MAAKKKLIFQNRQFSKKFCENFLDWPVLGLVELIDAKGIGMAQPIWP